MRDLTGDFNTEERVRMQIALDMCDDETPDYRGSGIYNSWEDEALDRIDRGRYARV